MYAATRTFLWTALPFRPFVRTYSRRPDLLAPRLGRTIGLLIHPRSCSARAARPQLDWKAFYARTQQRRYARQAFSYQRFQQGQNLFRSWAARPTFYYEIGGIGVLCGGFYVYNLEAVPVSGRRRFNVVSAKLEAEVAQSTYQQVMQQYGSKILPEYSREHRMVQRVLDRLIPHSGLDGQEWEMHVIDDGEKNAFVVPGGKVFVFRGILDICQGEDSLAAVLGHEIAHNLAHHAAERMSQAFVLVPIALIGSYLIGVDFGIGRFLTDLAFTLPGSRAQEQEADYIGLLMMAQSCFNPEAAIGFWGRMEKENKNAPPQFLSTHPSDHNRLDQIRAWMPEAEQRRQEGGCQAVASYGESIPI